MEAVLARIRSMGDKLAEDLSMLPDKPAERIEPVLSAAAEPIAEPVPQVLRQRRRSRVKPEAHPAAEPLDPALGGVEDFIVTPDGRALTNPDMETVQHLIEEDTAVQPPLPSAPAEEYSAQEIAGEFPKEVLKGFGVRQRADGIGVEIDPTIPPKPLPEPLSPEEEARASELIKASMAKPAELDAEDEDLKKQQEAAFAAPGSAAEAEVLRKYGRLPKETVAIPEEAVEEDTLLQTLKNDLATARERYVSVDLEKSSALLRLRNLLRFKQEVPLEDVDDARARYEEARLRFTQERLSRIERKYAGDRNDAYKREMAEALNFGEFEGRVQLYEARKQATINDKWSLYGAKITESLSICMHGYNRLKWYEKLAIGGALVGVTAAGGAVAFGAAFARAALAGGSLSVTLDAALEGRADARARQQAEEAGQKIFDKIAEIEAQAGSADLMADEETQAQKLRAFEASMKLFVEQHLQAGKETSGLFRERVDAMKRRKLLIGASGAALGLVIGKGWIGEGMQHVIDHGTGIEWLDRSFGLAALPDEGMIPPETVSEAGADPAVVPTEARPEVPAVSEQAEMPRAHAEGFSSEYSNFLKTANVKAGNTFWNIVSERTHSIGLGDARSEYLVDLIKDKAASLSPSEVRALGIASGDISQLRPGDRIDFTRLFGTQDLDRYISEARGVSEAALSSQAPTPNIDAVRAAALAKIDADLAIPSASVDIPATAEPVTAEIRPDSIPVAEVPVAEHAPRMDDWYAQIFRAENPAIGQDWVLNRSEIMHTKVSDIIRDTQAFAAGQVTGYRSGLSPEQYRNFYEFAAGLQKAGVISMTEFLRNNVNGTVEEYLKQAAPKAVLGASYGVFSTSR